MLFHSSENDNNKNDTKEVHMNCPQRQSFMIKLLKVLNKKKETQNVQMDYQKSSAKTYAFEW